jgi:caspase domain-containing protein/PEP-CTERM motif-containing protein
MIHSIPNLKKVVEAKGLHAVAASLILSFAFTLSSRADVWFLGVGNDGYYTDVAGIYGAYARLPNPHDTPIHSRLLSNHGGSTIISDIGWLTENAMPGDLAIFCYSGHGGSTYDYSHDEVTGWPRNSSDETIGRSSSWITDDRLTDAFEGMDPDVSLVAILDSCYSGGMVGGHDDLNTLANAFVMMSSREDQVSFGGSRYSRFTEQLIGGLGYGLPADTSHDGTITFDEWFGYSLGRVYGQTPQYFDAGTLGSLPLVPVPEPGTVLLLAVGGCAQLCRRRLFHGWGKAGS